MGDTSISWTQKTWNPIRGCRRVSTGCEKCYAERVATRFSAEGQPYAGLIKLVGKAARHPETGAVAGGGRGTWNGRIMFVLEHLLDPLRWRDPKLVFVNSMSDLFFDDEKQLTNEMIATIFVVMLFAKRHTFQILTKRPKRMRAWFRWAGERSIPDLIAIARNLIAFRSGSDRDMLALFDAANRKLGSYTWPLPNVWLGVSVENQEAADERIDDLLNVPAVVHFLSCEPLLGHVELQRLRGWLAKYEDDHCILRGVGHTRISWVIAGCESGPGMRRCDVAWLRSLRDQCAAAGTPFFLKQAVRQNLDDTEPSDVTTADGMYGDRRVVDPVSIGVRSKRKGHGRIIELPYLDGVQHAAMPKILDTGPGF